jgi:hypothetical protein
MTGLQINAIAVVVASIATHQLAALWTIFAYPTLLVLTFVFFVTRRLRGWSRLWKHESRIDSSPGTARLLSLSLRTTGPVALLLGVPLDITCYVRDPVGDEYEAGAEAVRLFRGLLYCVYPTDFPGAAELTPGTYMVTWRERKPAKSGKWHVMDVSRVQVPSQSSASVPLAGAAGGQTGYGATPP